MSETALLEVFNEITEVDEIPFTAHLTYLIAEDYGKKVSEVGQIIVDGLNVKILINQIPKLTEDIDLNLIANGRPDVCIQPVDYDSRGESSAEPIRCGEENCSVCAKK